MAVLANPASSSTERLGDPRRARFLRSAMAVCLFFAAAVPGRAQDRLQVGVAAARAHNYVKAAEIFLPLAASGDPRAQAFLGFMYQRGQGVPQNWVVSAAWYRCSANQGFANAQYELGLMYDKGHGVPQDYVLAYTWLNLAVAGAGPERDHWVVVRDAVLSKLTLLQRQTAQLLAFTQPPAQPCLPIETGL
ncbi:Sel1 domain protein repeat-containing protein [Methylocella silvestris BL2]|uniref:Sel1 domain protein repeat-containing protein n=1 Tax=Methylocella silvestris (strain DSM 15510 / CIP 108128 / LMG 27833 / NCIMB 13906 / BL2) TaxID=395965 RepID=B8ESI7_METSB|nr:tetratricopeptide repeat protein [Methylocella silvestris]ACK49877.1 Sel1 domain protein repeat-containing protein [Methylocella silvestris BL2]